MFYFTKQRKTFWVRSQYKICFQTILKIFCTIHGADKIVLWNDSNFTHSLRFNDRFLPLNFPSDKIFPFHSDTHTCDGEHIKLEKIVIVMTIPRERVSECVSWQMFIFEHTTVLYFPLLLAFARTKRWFICFKCNQINTCFMHTRRNLH